MANTLYKSYPPTEYTFVKHYFRIEGVEGATPSGPANAETEIVRWSAAHGRLVIVWQAERIGAIPVLPHPDTGNPNEVLRDMLVSPAVPLFTTNGNNRAIVIGGVYEYILKVPPKYTYSIGSAPHDPAGPSRFTVRNSDFQKGVFGPSVKD